MYAEMFVLSQNGECLTNFSPCEPMERKQMSTSQKQVVISLFEDGVNQHRMAEILGGSEFFKRFNQRESCGNDEHSLKKSCLARHYSLCSLYPSICIFCPFSHNVKSSCHRGHQFLLVDHFVVHFHNFHVEW
jgi:hypothetical protein